MREEKTAFLSGTICFLSHIYGDMGSGEDGAGKVGMKLLHRDVIAALRSFSVIALFRRSLSPCHSASCF